MGKHHPHDEEHRPLEGVIRDFNLSPKGTIEGVLLDTKAGVVQINFAPDDVPRGLSAGQAVEIVVETDHHAKKHPEGNHPVFQFVSMHGREKEEDGPVRVSGTVQKLNFARHGEPNGVILDTGDFIHLKPDGMKRHGLKVGQHITAEGDARPTTTGHRVIEATVVNGIPVGPKKPHKH